MTLLITLKRLHRRSALNIIEAFANHSFPCGFPPTFSLHGLAFTAPQAFLPMDALRAFTLRLFYFPLVLLLFVAPCVPPYVTPKVK